MPYQGFGAALGLGDETVAWGTEAARTVWMELLSESLKCGPRKRPRAGLGNRYAGRLNRQHFQEAIDAGGSVNVLVPYEGFGLVWKHLLGNVAAPTGTGPYSHVISNVEDLPNGLTLEPIRGDGTTEIFVGSMINKGVIRIEVEKEITAALDFISKSTAGRVAAGTPSWTTSRDLIASYVDAGNVSFNGHSYAFKSAEFTVDNKLGRRRLNGSPYTARPLPTTFQEMMVRLSIEWEDDTFNDAWTDDTVDDLTMLLTGSEGQTMNFEWSNCYVEDVSDPVNTAGVISQEVVLRPQAASSNPGLKLTLVNDQATALLA